MADCRYILKKEINGIVHELRLDREEIATIWTYYEDFMAEEQIIKKLIDDYNVEDISKFKSVIDDLVYRYNKCRGNGCDEEYSLQIAFEENSEEIENLLTA